MQVELRDSADLRRLVRQLRDVAGGKELRRELTAGLRAAVRPVVPRVKAAYLQAPSRRGGTRRRSGPGLRSLLAKATRMEVRTSGRQAGVRVRVDGRRMPSGMKALPQAWEGEKRWRHPVFGNREVWVQQDPQPVFYRTVQPYEAQVRREVEQAVERVVAPLRRGR